MAEGPLRHESLIACLSQLTLDQSNLPSRLIDSQSPPGLGINFLPLTSQESRFSGGQHPQGRENEFCSLPLGPIRTVRDSTAPETKDHHAGCWLTPVDPASLVAWARFRNTTWMTPGMEPPFLCWLSLGQCLVCSFSVTQACLLP